MFQSVGKDLLIVTACKNQPYCRFKIHLYQKVYIFAVIKFVVSMSVDHQQAKISYLKTKHRPLIFVVRDAIWIN